MKHFFLQAILFSISSILFAQSDYRNGYIITNAGEKQSGWIDFKGGLLNSKSCSFKTDTLAEAKRYMPGEIKAYRFENSKYYASKEIKDSGSSKTVFLECLIEGKVTIYYLLNESGEHYYIEKDGKLSEMLNKDVSFEKGGTRYVHKSGQYKGILKYYMSDCPDLTSQITDTEFDKKSLIKISKTYHERVCKDKQCIVYEKNIQKVKLHLGVVASYGIQNMNFSFVGDSYTYFKGNSTYYGQIELLSRINMGEKERTFVQLNLGYCSAAFNTTNGSDARYTAKSIKYRYDCITSELQLGYRFLLGKIRPFATIGIPVRIITLEDGTCTTLNDFTYKFDNQGNIAANTKYVKPENLLAGGDFGLGAEYKLPSQKSVFVLLKYEQIRTLTAFSFSAFKLSTGICF